MDSITGIRLILYCPVDYDGAVFCIGDWPRELGEPYFPEGDEAEKSTMRIVTPRGIQLWEELATDVYTIGKGEYGIEDVPVEKCNFFTVADE